MSKKMIFYLIFSVLLLALFYYLVFKDYNFTKSPLPVINDNPLSFTLINQNGKTITEKDVDQKVFVVEYFFTTCRGICPKMNANMRRVYDVFKDEPNFKILSHTCMPEVDSVPILKAHEQKVLTSSLVKDIDGSYLLKEDTTIKPVMNATNWEHVTGDKKTLYTLARQNYLVDNNKRDTLKNITDEFIHTQFFALVDKNGRLRGIYDGLINSEIEKLVKDINGLLKEKISSKRFMGGFNNNPS
jgi:protein SCO1